MLSKKEFIKTDLVEYLMFITSKFVKVKYFCYLDKTEEYLVICFDDSEYFISSSEVLKYFSNRKFIQPFFNQF